MVHLSVPDAYPAGDDAGVLPPVGGRLPRSNWQELGAMLPDVGRLLRDLMADPRVPRRSRWLAGAAALYVAVPVDPLPDLVPGTGYGLDDVVAVVWALRHLIATAGYEVVRELWTGTDAGFALLILIAGVDR
jgi:uncharacterized membrane protein YkvA (DUF1232 family)